MKYIATGRVHPERADIRFAPVTWHVPGEGSVVAQCDSSQITVRLELKSIDGFVTAYIAAEHFSQMIVGALGFALGTGYAVELIQITEEDGTPHVFGVRPTGDTSDETLGFAPHDPVLNRAFSLANSDVFFRLALRDYLRAMTDTTDCATYCYRAIEAIKSAFSLKTGDPRWNVMHNALGTDRTIIDATVKVYADPVRHGNWVSARITNGQERWQMLVLTREILSRYLDHELPAT